MEFIEFMEKSSGVSGLGGPLARRHPAASIVAADKASGERLNNHPPDGLFTLFSLAAARVLKIGCFQGLFGPVRKVA